MLCNTFHDGNQQLRLNDWVRDLEWHHLVCTKHFIKKLFLRSLGSYWTETDVDLLTVWPADSCEPQLRSSLSEKWLR